MNGKPKAFAVHLAVSVTAAGAFLWVLMRLWYPMPYFAADGGWQGIRVVVAVDVILGPLLSLVVYNRRKSRKTLAFDYTVIGLLQCAAFAFGVWTVFEQRTALVVFADGAFYTVAADRAASMGPHAKEIVGTSPAAPAYAAVRMTNDHAGQQSIRREALSTGKPVFLRDDLLEPLECRELSGTGAHGVDLVQPEEQLRTQFREEANAFLRQHGNDPGRYLFVPLTARYQDFTLVFDRDTCHLEAWLSRARPLHGSSKAPGERS